MFHFQQSENIASNLLEIMHKKMNVTITDQGNSTKIKQLSLSAELESAHSQTVGFEFLKILLEQLNVNFNKVCMYVCMYPCI